MDKTALKSALAALQDELMEASGKLEAMESELVVLQDHRSKLQAAVSALENLIAGPTESPEPPGLTDAIIDFVARRPNMPRPLVASRVTRLVPSKSADPTRVALVRIAQLIKEGKLVEINGRLQVPNPRV